MDNVFSTSYRNHENGNRGFKFHQALAYANAMGAENPDLLAAWIISGVGGTDPVGLKELAPSQNRMMLNPLQGGGKDLPVLGAARGGSDAVFFDNGKIVEHIQRPEFLIGAPDSYAVYMTGDSMEPRYLASELLFVNPARIITRGCFVVIQKTNEEALVKRFVSQCDAAITVEQYNPEERFKIPRSEVAAIHRIVGSKEA
tara:strand:+ start:126 stop:725 length:600 start_codon:yes stop_codon:yes gene_type:complete